ncbi:MAG: GNAT family N-acetyltransferase [Rhodanobacteraceae bacterium]
MAAADKPQVVAAPVIETARLRLRAHRAADLPGCHAIWSDPDVVRHIGGHPSNVEESWRRMLNYAGLWSLLGFGYWVIEEKRDSGYIGEVGFADFGRDMQPSLRGMLECGWVLARSAHGNGFATEAVAAIEAWREKRFPERHAVCIIAPENRASLRVAEKTGFRLWCETTYRGDPTWVYAREPFPDWRPEWNSN